MVLRSDYITAYNTTLDRGSQTIATPTVHLYDDQLPWPKTEEGQYAKNFLEPLIRDGVKTYVDNVNTTLMLLMIDEYLLPMTINDGEYENSYVCSPYGQYILYAIETLGKELSEWKKKKLTNLLNNFGKILKIGKINKLIFVNNWLFSTDIYPKLTEEHISKIKEFLINRFPGHTIAFRSINAAMLPATMKALKKQKFDLIPSKQIYYTNTNENWVFETRIVQSDLKLLKKSDYHIVNHDELTEEEIPTIHTLYTGLFQDKHSKLTPKFTQQFFHLAFKSKLLDLKVLRKEGKIDGILGAMIRQGILFCPVIGYDTTLPPNTGLYRLLSTLLMLESKKRGTLFHQSAGAAFYKTIRRAKPEMEYIAVYTRHLPLKQRMPWVLLKAILSTIGVRVMRKY
jgi:hypothetical protein